MDAEVAADITNTDELTRLRERVAELEASDARRRQAEEALRAQARQQAAVAELSHRALQGAPLDTLLREAVTLVASALDAPFASLSEWLPDGKRLALRAAVGWEPELIGQNWLAAEPGTRTAYALAQAEPVLVADHRTETRFATDALWQAQGIVSSLTVVVQGRAGPFGLLCVATTAPRRFRHDHAQCLRAIANTLAAAVARAGGDDQLAESEQRFRALVELAPDIIFSVRADDGVITALNPAFETVTGWPRAEWVGQPFGPLATGDDLELVREQLARVAAGETPEPFMARVLSPTDEAIALEVRAAPRFEDDRVVEAFGIARDMTARRAVEDELRRSRDELAIILHGVADAITVQDASGRITYANLGAARALGFGSVAELQSAPLSDIMGRFVALTADGAPFPLDDLPGRRALREGQAAEALVRFRIVATQEERWALVKAMPVFDAQGAPRYAINIFQDMTARRAAEQRQRFLTEASERLVGSLDYATTLQLLADLSVPTLADWCIVNIVEADAIVRGAIAYRDPAHGNLLRQLQQRYPPNLDSARGVAHVLRTGEPWLTPEFGPEQLDNMARDAAHRALLEELAPRATLVVPLTARGRVLGAVSLGSAQRRFDADDLALAHELATRAAVALDNALLYRDATRAVARLGDLARASEAFAAAQLDLSDVLEALARHVVTTVGDGCVIRLVSADGAWLEARAVAHVDPAIEAGMRAEPSSTPMALGEGYQGQVARTGEAVLMPRTNLRTMTPTLTQEHRDWFARHEIHSLLIVPIRARGAVIGTVGVTRDRTVRSYAPDDRTLLQDLADRAGLAIENARLYAEAQEALTRERAAREEAQDAARQREEFLSIASHELKTPLTSIKGSGQLLDRWLRRPELDRARLEGASTQLLGEVNRLELLVTDLLDATRLQQGRLQLRRELVDLAELTRAAVARFEHAPERHAQHQLTVEAARPVVGHWDATRLEQVLTNLLSNALKYSPEGGAVTARVTVDGPDALLEISDDGIGIRPDDLAQVFQPFQRGANAQQRAGGSGLGLYITAQIVEQHGGHISVVSEPGVGSTFSVRLPLQPPA